MKTVFPPVFDILNNPVKTLIFFRELKNGARNLGANTDLIIDLEDAKQISPEAALVLIAELARTYRIAKCRLLGRQASDPQLHELLGQIGYYKYFPKITFFSNHSETRVFLKHHSETKHRPAPLRNLVELFSPGSLPVAQGKLLYRALSECVSNVMIHAYPTHDHSRLHNRWWILGSRDTISGEIYFCFFDQGVGIGNTIRTRFGDRIPGLKTDSELILKAVDKGHYSRTQDKTRGRGLPTLKQFVDSSADGELTIVSRKSRCTFRKGFTPVAEDVDYEIDGTLIVWRLKSLP